MRRKHIFLSLLVVVLVLGFSVGHAWSYFTDTTMAEGSITLSVQPDTSITEEYDPSDQKKVVTIHNDSDVVPVRVRARAYVPAILNGKVWGDKWVGEDGSLAADDANQWFAYEEVLAPGADTNPINVKLNFKDAFKNTEAHDGDELNVVVIYECLPVGLNE